MRAYARWTASRASRSISGSASDRLRSEPTRSAASGTTARRLRRARRRRTKTAAGASRASAAAEPTTSHDSAAEGRPAGAEVLARVIGGAGVPPPVSSHWERGTAEWRAGTSRSLRRRSQRPSRPPTATPQAPRGLSRRAVASVAGAFPPRASPPRRGAATRRRARPRRRRARGRRRPGRPAGRRRHGDSPLASATSDTSRSPTAVAAIARTSLRGRTGTARSSSIRPGCSLAGTGRCFSGRIAPARRAWGQSVSSCVDRERAGSA